MLYAWITEFLLTFWSETFIFGNLNKNLNSNKLNYGAHVKLTEHHPIARLQYNIIIVNYVYAMGLVINW